MPMMKHESLTELSEDEQLFVDWVFRAVERHLKDATATAA
jgi:hypothetical protein